MMKILAIVITMLLSISMLNAQDKNKKILIEVKGNCGMCKARIEKSTLKLNGVKYASWDIPSKKLSIVIDESKCSVTEIRKAIADVGHDTNESKAQDKVYNNLPACCKYRDPKSAHMNHNKN